jgi:hypothetical protein
MCRARPRIDRNKLGTGRRAGGRSHVAPTAGRRPGRDARALVRTGTPSLIVSRPNRRLDLITRVTRQNVASLFGTLPLRRDACFFFTEMHVEDTMRLDFFCLELTTLLDSL